MSDTTEFPKLMWLKDGREVTVADQDEQDRQTIAGASLFAPGTPAAEVPVVIEDAAEEAAEDDEVEAAAEEADEEAESETPKKKRSRK